MEQLDKDQLPQNWRAPLIKVVSNHVWQVCERVDMTDPANHPSVDGSGKSPAYGAYAGPVEQLLNNAFEGALKNWEIGPFAAWIGKTKVFNDLDLQWDFAISLPNQHLTRPVGSAEPTGTAATVRRPTRQPQGAARANCDATSFGYSHHTHALQTAAMVEEEEDIPVEEQWSLIVWLKPGERGTTVDLRRFTAVVDKMANPAFIKSADGSWDIFLSHFQGNAGNTVMSLKALLESASPGLRCWLDKDEDATEAGMRRGVAGSKYYLVFLTKGVFTRPFVQLEAREALALGKPVILVHETDQRFGAAPGFNDYVAEAPPDLKQIFSLANSIPWYREEEFRAGDTSEASAFLSTTSMARPFPASRVSMARHFPASRVSMARHFPASRVSMARHFPASPRY
ncbi:hypothetical protein VOLCADRAFT_96659 [Volvox carteri f. nagariensis]|uniref:TIR domain-containing protein n=1 Tax=Volvox carteri f. nagariensis TaxID=3068 RepID=D8UAQ1_VOLCA|nr:uncharacterized protein VOLCADRAFT_96659 [Volvox carteri f. nagariensis]EFJ43194.1 hypothetical protein VOLCADRAFT_96659 [Volvox carteri f. nagariensis]|eukprot:XP_002955769.1 hypothetical protein VOLCADRAFT_96659 [Volvox carteri f. nagariensis]